ncbi:hypothetical protein GCM10027417_28380 [Glutamicibacter endophyticus]
MQSVDDYLSELQFSLSLRNIDNPTIRDIIAEVSSECTTYPEAIEKFGEPAEYAASFPEGRAKGYPRLFFFSGVLLAGLWIITNIVLRESSTEKAITAGSMMLTYLPALGIIAVGILVDFLRAHRRAAKI